MRPRSQRRPHTLSSPSAGSRASRAKKALILVAASLAVACNAPLLESPEIEVNGQETIVIPPPREQVDVLFLVDNSNSMEDMNVELRQRFQQFIAYFRDLAAQGKYADLHIGVVTSDYGAGPAGVSGSTCVGSPGPLMGGAGRLVRRGAAAPGGCEGPTGPSAFLRYKFDANGGSGNLPAGQTPEQTFTCMASVGTQGCGFEHVLESTYAALHNNLPENAGFLRKDAILAVVFVTNEDDCSAPPSSDLFEASPNKYGYVGSFRCARFGITCGGQPLPTSASAPLQGCAPAMGPAGGALYDLARYVDLFTRPASQGGLKDDPKDVILVGITPPDAPVQVVMTAEPNSGASYPPCVEGGRCVPVVQRSCKNSQLEGFFGDPAVRLNAVIRAAHGRTHSICDADYSGALGDLSERINSRLGDGCIEQRLADRLDPDCAVEQVVPGASPTPIPRCDRMPGTLPCWRLEEKTGCESVSPDGVGITVDRGGAQPPPGASVNIRCHVLGGP